jgi:hypothetical protein
MDELDEIFKPWLVLSVILLIILGAGAGAAASQHITATPKGGQPQCYGNCDSANITGKWRVSWHSSQSNTVLLTSTGIAEGNAALFKGQYVADDSKICPAFALVRGTGNDGTVLLRVVCQTWSLRLYGDLELDGSEVQGRYTATAPSQQLAVSRW